MSKQFVSEIKDRDPVNAVFLVKDKILAMAKNGKPYMNLRLMDKSGDIEAKVWDNTELLDKQFDKDDFVKVRGKASVYMNKMQVVIAEIAKVPEEQVALADFLPESPRDGAEMRQELTDTVAALGNPHLKGLMEAFMADEPVMELYCQAPAAKGMHHVYLGDCWNIRSHWSSWPRASCLCMAASTKICWWSGRCCTMSARSMR